MYTLCGYKINTQQILASSAFFRLAKLYLLGKNYSRREQEESLQRTEDVLLSKEQLCLHPQVSPAVVALGMRRYNLVT